MTECVKVLVEVKPKEYLFFSADFSAQIYYILPIAIYWFWRKIRMIFFALGLVTSSFALVIRYLSTLASFSSNCNSYILTKHLFIRHRFYHKSYRKLFSAGHALGIWICGWSLLYKRELWASKLAGAKGDVPKICGFVHPH